jgi:repressor LexA
MPALHFTIADELTEFEAKVLDHLACTLRPGFCPSREELSRAAGLGGRGYRINKILESLEQKGFLRVAPGRFRAITLLRRPDGRPFRFETVWVPMVGLIGASQPRQTATQPDNVFTDEAIELTRNLLRGQDATFALRVSGDSMVDALVNDGDIVILSAAADVHNGDMVAARVTEDDGREATTLKYFFRENGHVRLQHANPILPPLPFYRPEQVAVYGKVVLIIRQMG